MIKKKFSSNVKICVPLKKIFFFFQKKMFLQILASTFAFLGGVLLGGAGSIASESTILPLTEISVENNSSLAEEAAVVDISLLKTNILAGVSPKTHKIYPVQTDHLSWWIDDSSFNITANVYYPVGYEGKTPVVIFSHGLGSSSERCGYLGKMWASRGIVSIYLEHPGSNEEIWRGSVWAKSILTEALQQYWNGRDRALCIRHVIDYLVEISSPESKGTHLGHEYLSNIDTERIGVCGNDLGGLAALLLAGQLPPDNGTSLKDERVKAIVALSPPVYCSSEMAPLVYADVNIPFMSFAGTLDDGVIGKTRAWQRRIPFDSIHGVPRFHVTLTDADHFVYSGVRWRNQQIPVNDFVYQKTIMDITTAFWSLFLNNDNEAASLLLNGAKVLPVQMGQLEYHLN